MFTDVSKGPAACFFKVEVAGLYEMLVYMHQSVRCLIPGRGTYGIAICRVLGKRSSSVCDTAPPTAGHVIEGKIEGRIEVTGN